MIILHFTSTYVLETIDFFCIWMVEAYNTCHCTSLPNSVFGDHMGSLNLARVGVFIPWKLANVTNLGFFPQRARCQAFTQTPLDGGLILLCNWWRNSRASSGRLVQFYGLPVSV